MKEVVLRQYIREVLGGFGNKNAGRDGIPGNLRYGEPILKRGGNVLDDEDQEAEQQQQDDEAKGKLAAVVLIIADDGKILAVSRRDDPTAMGLPGGKVDPAEEPADAAARELQEETGLTATDLKPVFTNREEDGFTTTTFVGKVSGQINTSEEGVIRWVDWQELFDGPFGEYNKKLHAKLGLS